MVFKSEVGPVFYGVVALVLVIAGAALISALESTNITELLIVGFSLVPVLALFAWILLTTDYTVTEDELRIRCGPRRIRIRRRDIHSINSSRNPIASPALSMDRLEIHYGENKHVLVSPKNRNAFCEALGFASQPSA